MADETNSVEPTNSATLWTIKPTATERAYGRLMRGPDGHDAGDGGADAGAGAAGGDDGAQGSGSADAGDGAGASDGDTVLGSAAAEGGAGDAPAKGPEAGKDGEGDAGKNDPVIPEKYEISLTVKDAEGKDQPVEIDTALLDAATPVLKDLGLTNEQANKVAGLVPQVQQRLLQQQTDDFAATKTQWAKEAAEDKDIGGKNWKETQTLAARALDHFGAAADSDFRKLLNETGLGNHPVMIGMFRKIGAALSEDAVFAQGDGKIQKKSREEELYPDDVPKK